MSDDLAPDPRELALAEQRAAEKERAERARRMEWVVYVNGQRSAFRVGDMTPAEFGALKAGPGMSLAEILDGVFVREPISVGALVWLARRQSGESGLTWVEVSNSLKLSDEVVIDVGERSDEDSNELPDPPA